jgi:hypothetical protein
MNTPQAKKPVVAELQPQPWRAEISRVTTSQKDRKREPRDGMPAQHHQTYFKRIERRPFQMAMAGDHQIFLDKISPCRHTLRAVAIAPRPSTFFMFCLFHVADKLEDLDRMRAQFLGELDPESVRRLL